ncbi:MAG: hypothetical protein NZ521_03865 [Flammeovirgaceae bacterium]|nr:hypothetical protein [Flammeovirgaceae bacterium]MDW8287332.1 hypothetical protein [Flammeovirgaceae bacterium]
MDIHVEVARLQKQIETHLSVQGSLIFDFQQEDKRVKLNLITVNTRHNQSFLFHSVYGIDRLDALNKMLDYVKNYQDSENSYTIQWRIKGDKELQTSYFRAKNIYEALDKLYYNRDLNAIIVYSVVLNPMA